MTPVDWSETCIGCQYCCRYVALEIDPPKSRAARDIIRWYLAHRRIHVYIGHEGSWYFLVNTECDNLTADGCRIYDNRFQICRQYDPATCEMTRGTAAEAVLFRTVEDFDRWYESSRRPARPRAARRGADSPGARRGRQTVRPLPTRPPDQPASDDTVPADPESLPAS